MVIEGCGPLKSQERLKAFQPPTPPRLSSGQVAALGPHWVTSESNTSFTRLSWCGAKDTGRPPEEIRCYHEAVQLCTNPLSSLGFALLAYKMKMLIPSSMGF